MLCTRLVIRVVKIHDSFQFICFIQCHIFFSMEALFVFTKVNLESLKKVHSGYLNGKHVFLYLYLFFTTVSKHHNNASYIYEDDVQLFSPTQHCRSDLD